MQNDASGSAALQLKTSLKEKVGTMLDMQRQLDEVRNGLNQVKDLLAQTAKVLCDTQEVIRALSAMAYNLVC